MNNKKQESSIGLIRVLPLALFGYKFNEADFERLIKGIEIAYYRLNVDYLSQLAGCLNGHCLWQIAEKLICEEGYW